MMEKTNTEKQNSFILSLREKIGYGFGDLASVLYWQTFMLYFTYFYTDVFLLPTAVAATMFLVSRIFDAVNDPMMGIIADRTNTKWGKFRPYLLWLCVPFAVAGVLVFTTPNLGMTGKIIWAYSTFILIMVLYTAINIPYTSLLGVISPSSSERTTVSSVKFMFAFFAGIIISATLLPMAKSLGSGDESIISAELNNKVLTVNEVTQGNAKIVLIAEDADNNEGKLEFGFKVNPKENNIPRIVKPVNDLKLESGFGKYNVDISDVFIGDEGNDFEHKVNSTNKEVADVELKDKTLIIIEKNIGNTKIDLTAKDKRWGDRTQSFYVQVLSKGNNDPVLSDSTDLFKLKKGFGTEEVNLSDIIVDPDGDKLIFTAESNNSKVITPIVEGSLLSFTEDKSGIAELKIVATDGKGGQLIHNIKYLISEDGNNPPFVNKAVGNITETVGFNSYQIDISDLFVDPESSLLSYRIKVINNARGWQRSFMIFGIAAIIFFLIAFKSTRERVQPPITQKTSIGKDLIDLYTNKPWLILLATTITFILFVAIRSSVTVHYFKYVIGVQELKLPFFGAKAYDFEALTSFYNTIGQISSLLGVLIVNWFAKVVGKKRAFIIFFVIAIFSTGIIYFLTAEQLGLIYFFQVTGSITGGPLSVLIWAMYADTADYGEWKQGRRATGLIFSASTMSQKFGWAFGAFIALQLMAQLGFQPNEAQSRESLRGLLLLFSLIPAGMGVISILLCVIYPLNDRVVAKIESELNNRRKEEEN